MNKLLPFTKFAGAGKSLTRNLKSFGVVGKCEIMLIEAVRRVLLWRNPVEWRCTAAIKARE
jgi:hypothetical protein